MSKRIIVPLLLLCLLLTACGQNANPTQPITTQPTSNSPTVPTNSAQDCLPLFTLLDIESYREYIGEAELPENFVYYENVAQFGDFFMMVFYTTKPDEFVPDIRSNYSYAFIDGAGNYIWLDIRYGTWEYEIVDSKYWGDMRTGDPTIDKKKACVERNGIRYQYLGGKLRYISWESNGLCFLLDAYSKGVFYPEDGPVTFIQELLHTDTNKAALERFEAALNTPAVK